MVNYNYNPHTAESRQEMLEAIEVKSQEDLFNQIPASLRDTSLSIPEGLSELELQKKLLELARKNLWQGEYLNFMGAGCYNRYVPAVIDHIISRAEFLTAYTPYQPEISQGTLQAIYEYQSMMCTLTGMDVSNASMYDGATAAAEAILMACRITKKSKAIISKTINPEYQYVISTYASKNNTEIIFINNNLGETDLNQLKEVVDDNTACVLIEMPNFLGNIENYEEIEKLTHEAKALFIVAMDPISVGLLKPPGSYGADIVIGDGQQLGSYVFFGGPSFGFMACKQNYLRNLPGRIVGATVDNKGNKAYTLTLQTREQHIRRDKATSNICSNHSLNAIAASIYLSVVGPQGLKEIATLSFQRAHYLADKLSQIQGFQVAYETFLNEFVLLLPKHIDVTDFINEMEQKRILPGVKISQFYTELPNALLVSVTENNPQTDLFLYATMANDVANKLKAESTVTS